jgi:murein DD-endopeptidase MepM/ murein hydrolase activator NlpD
MAKLRARLKEALHRYSLFGKVVVTATRRLHGARQRLATAQSDVRRLRTEERRALDLHHQEVPQISRRALDNASEALAIAEIREKKERRKVQFWEKRLQWATDRHEQWGNVLRRRRTAVRRWLRIHRTYGAGGWAPTSFWVRQRVDQGQDFEIKLGHRVRAPGDGEVTQWAHDGPFPNGFGDPYAIVRIDTGPFAGRLYYIGHANEAVPRVGLKFKEGDLLSRANNSLNAGLGWIELGLWPPGGPTNGSQIAGLFKEVRA